MADPASDIPTALRLAEEGVLWECATDLAVIEVRGSDRVKWLNGLVTCDVTKLVPGVVSYGLVVGRTGKLQADVRIVEDDARLLLVVPAAVRDDLLATFERHLIMEDVELAPLPQQTWIGTGPEALAAASALGALSAFPVASWDRTGKGGALAFQTPSNAAPVTDAGPAAATAVRLRYGIAKWADDFDTTLYPHEASLEKVAVAFDKGCYLGQEVVCMVELRGQVKRKLVLLQGEAPLARGARILSVDNTDIGEVRSSADTPDGHRAIALIKIAFTAPDTELRVSGAGEAPSTARVLKICGRA